MSSLMNLLFAPIAFSISMTTIVRDQLESGLSTENTLAHLPITIAQSVLLVFAVNNLLKSIDID